MNRKTILAAFIVIAILSGTVIYPAVHETGHLLAGHIQGLHVKEVTWTTWGGNPHVAFHENRPPSVEAWVAPAGMLLPTAVGSVLLMVWLLAPRISWFAGVLLCFPGLVLLTGNLGVITEITYSAGERYCHMRPLADYLNLSGTASIAFQLMPALYSSLFFVAVFNRIYSKRKKLIQQTQTETNSKISASAAPETSNITAKENICH